MVFVKKLANLYLISGISALNAYPARIDCSSLDTKNFNDFSYIENFDARLDLCGEMLIEVFRSFLVTYGIRLIILTSNL